jgi:glutamyl-tRNA reductase
LKESTNRFFVVGLSFKKTDLTQRSKFAFNAQQCAEIYSQVHSDCLDHFFILSTCNRTEVYGFAPCEYVLTGLLQQSANDSASSLKDLFYIKEGTEAVKHFFEVASGLDSQIPGDYEIISQIKSSFQLAKQHNRANGYLEKLFNFSLQASKEVKNTTSFSDGTLSVSFAVVQQLTEKQELKEISVLGAGETGELTIKYIRKFLPEVKINLINRDAEKRNHLAEKYDLKAFALNDLASAIRTSQALLVTTNAESPIVYNEHVKESSIQWIYDLSVPQNVAKEVYELKDIHSFDIDTISKEISATLQSRLNEIPKVEAIITDFTKQFTEWSYRHHYFSVAGQLQNGLAHPVSKKALHTLFKKWQETALTDSSLVPYGINTRQSMLTALKNNFPGTFGFHSEEKKEIHHACTTNGHAKQPACFMANQCCRVSAHPAW